MVGMSTMDNRGQWQQIPPRLAAYGLQRSTDLTGRGGLNDPAGYVSTRSGVRRHGGAIPGHDGPSGIGSGAPGVSHRG